MADFTTPLPQAGGASATFGDSDGSLLGGLKALFAFVTSRELWMGYASQIMSDSKSFFNPAEFSRPASQTEWVARVSMNSTRFRLMYFCLFLPFLLNTMLSTWWLRIGSFTLLALWAYAYGVKKDDASLTVAGVALPKTMAVGSISVLVMLVTGMLNALIGALLLFSLIGMPHMSLHQAPTAADAIDALELQPVNTSPSA